MTEPSIPRHVGDGQVFDIRMRRRKSMYKGAAVGLFVGLAGWVPGTVQLVRGSGSAGQALIVMAVCAPFLALGAVLLVASIQVTRSGPDLLGVDPQGITRTSRTCGFDVAWVELARVDVVATQVVAGYDPYTTFHTRAQKFGATTALRFQPVDPAGFTATHATVTTADADVTVQRLVQASFGIVFTMGEPDRSTLVAALAQFAGPRFGGVTDETSAAQWRGR